MRPWAKAILAGALTEAVLLGTWYAAGLTGGHGSPPPHLFGVPGFLVHVPALEACEPLFDRIAASTGICRGLGPRIMTVSVALALLWTLPWYLIFRGRGKTRRAADDR